MVKLPDKRTRSIPPGPTYFVSLCQRRMTHRYKIAHNLYLNNFHHLNIHSWRSVKFLTMTEKVVHLKILRTIKKNKLKQTDEQ